MTKFTLLLFTFSSLLFIGCSSEDEKLFQSSEKISIVDDEDSLMSNKLTGNKERILRIKALFEECPTISLPFVSTSEDYNLNEQLLSDSELDSIVFGKDGPYYIIGVIPDTSNFFGFFYFGNSEDPNPTVLTFDKLGNQIVNESLTQSCWHGCESDCRYNLEIDNNLYFKFEYDYFEFNHDLDAGVCAETPNKASGYIKESYLDSLGHIIPISNLTKPSKELMMNPILHNYDQ